MYQPNENDLNEATKYFVDSPEEYAKKLKRTATDSPEFIALWASLVAGALDIEIPTAGGATAANLIKFLDQIKDADQKVFTTAQRGLLAGIEMGIYIGEQQNGVSTGPREAIPTTEALKVAAKRFAVDGMAGGIEQATKIADIYEKLIENSLFHTLMELSYSLSKRIHATEGSTPLDRESALVEMKSNPDLTRGVGVALAIGLMIGGLLPLNAPASQPQEASKPKIMGGWR